MDTETKNILVVEDEEKILAFIESYLQNSGYHVFKAYRGLDALRLFREHPMDLVVLDLMLPDLSGEQICREIRRSSTVPIIMLTAKAQEENILQGFELGADDYITKPFSPRQLVARVKALLRRSTFPAEEALETLDFDGGALVIDPSAHVVWKRGASLSLTPSEFKLLLTLARRPRKVFTREELIQIAFEDDYAGYDRTIDSHIKNLRAKLEDDPRNSRYISTVRGIGYRFGGGPE
ncbi:response regulator transcription factor [Anaerotalea alkaliphila]|uniref:Stage 0 sporulation protein A homolog n=1 Tax=Anaerotalea alkaliphila TaxID=2662126 RepID=A0A7X5KM95_9FIRM|nr:response regulator transcription factor [Anaerotalea alkaliphila]NDL66483.1 response regulator transcription factor [Anaerotalea alkaliphila]